MKYEVLTGGPLDVNCYVLTDEATGAAAVIDPGFFDDRLRRVAETGNVKMILLTHGHFDHMAGAEELRRATAAPILAMETERALLADAEANASRQFFGRDRSLDPDRGLSDGEALRLGETVLTVMAAPGHTAGGCCYLTKDAAFTGDTLMEYSVGRSDLPTGDQYALLRSVQKLAGLPGDPDICGGHGAVTKFSAEKERNPFLHYFIAER